MVGFAAVELDQPRTHASHPVPDHVDRDAVQPGALLQFPYASRRVGAQSAVGAEEGVLRHLFGIVAVAGHREARREDAVLVLAHHPLEEVVDALHHTPMNTAHCDSVAAAGTIIRRRL